MYTASLGQAGTRQAINLPREFTRGGLGLVYPETNDLSRYTFGQEEQVSWARKNWKWLALGGGGLVAVAIALKLAL